jgi:hypothetical protein
MAIDLNLLAIIIQTIVLTLTLLVFIFQFRSQEKAIRESAYQNVMGRYNDYIMSGTSADDAWMARLFPSEKKIATEEASLIRRLMIAYGILEEAHELYKKRWIDKGTWDQWDAWLTEMCKIPQFALLHQRSTGMFNRDFQEHVSELIVSISSEGKDGQRASRT